MFDRILEITPEEKDFLKKTKPEKNEIDFVKEVFNAGEDDKIKEILSDLENLYKKDLEADLKSKNLFLIAEKDKNNEIIRRFKVIKKFGKKDADFLDLDFINEDFIQEKFMNFINALKSAGKIDDDLIGEAEDFKSMEDIKSVLSKIQNKIGGLSLIYTSCHIKDAILVLGFKDNFRMCQNIKSPGSLSDKWDELKQEFEKKELRIEKRDLKIPQPDLGKINFIWGADRYVQEAKKYLAFCFLFDNISDHEERRAWRQGLKDKYSFLFPTELKTIEHGNRLSNNSLQAVMGWLDMLGDNLNPKNKEEGNLQNKLNKIDEEIAGIKNSKKRKDLITIEKLLIKTLEYLAEFSQKYGKEIKQDQTRDLKAA